MQTLNRRAFLKFSGIVAGSAALAACAAPAAPAPAAGGEQAAASQEQALVTYLVRTDIGTGMLEWNDKAVADFTEKRPDIKVEMIGVPWGDYNAKLLAMFAAGTPPEISANYAAGFATFYLQRRYHPAGRFCRRAPTRTSRSSNRPRSTPSPAKANCGRMPLAHMPVLTFYNKAISTRQACPFRPPTATTSRGTSTRCSKRPPPWRTTSKIRPTPPGAWSFPTGQLGVYCWRWGFDPFNNQGGPELTEAYQTGKVTEAFYDRPEMAEFFQWLHRPDLQDTAWPHDRPTPTP